MIRDRSILARFAPDGSLRQEYLCRDEALFEEAEWFWGGSQSLAWVFESHAEAEDFAKGHRYTAQDGRLHEPWALVCGGEQPGDSPRERALRARDAGAKTRARFALGGVSSEECFEQLEKRRLA